MYNVGRADPILFWKQFVDTDLKGNLAEIFCRECKGILLLAQGRCWRYSCAVVMLTYFHLADYSSSSVLSGIYRRVIQNIKTFNI
jgi:hypothetical protein